VKLFLQEEKNGSKGSNSSPQFQRSKSLNVKMKAVHWEQLSKEKLNRSVFSRPSMAGQNLSRELQKDEVKGVDGHGCGTLFLECSPAFVVV